MKLYEIDERLQELADLLVPDEETGEIVGNVEDIFRQIDELEGERTKKLEGICCYINNLKADYDAYKNEEAKFKAKKLRTEKKVQSLENYLAFALAGQDAKLGVHTVKFSKRPTVKIYNEEACLRFLKAKGYNDCIKVKEEVKKTEIGKLIDEGIEVDFATKEPSGKISIK